MTDAERGYKLSENSSLLLDVVRAAASQAVVIGHGISYFSIWPKLQPPHFPYIQNLAVLVFFVLSGFLITYATLRKPAGYTFREFFIDRFARIYSAYVVALVLVFVIDRIAIALDPTSYGYRSAFDVRTFFANVFMLQDYPRAELHQLAGEIITSFGSARPFWTLAIEWWIYMCFGWVVLRQRDANRIIFIVVLAAFAIVPVTNILGGRGNGLGLVWIFGAATYVLASNDKLSRARGDTLALASLAFLGLAVMLLRNTKEPYDPKLGALIAAALLFGVLALDRFRWKAPSWLAGTIRFVANYSFTLYLLHYTLLDLFAHHRPFASPTLSFLIAAIACNALSVVVAYCTEFRHKAFAGWLKARYGRANSQ
jgi:peptidoglycan/LPS O-acetylase OafA/YrhL